MAGGLNDCRVHHRPFIVQRFVGRLYLQDRVVGLLSPRPVWEWPVGRSLNWHSRPKADSHASSLGSAKQSLAPREAQHVAVTSPLERGVATVVSTGHTWRWGRRMSDVIEQQEARGLHGNRAICKRLAESRTISRYRQTQ